MQSLDGATGGIEELDGRAEPGIADRVAIDVVDQAAGDAAVGERAVAQRQEPGLSAALGRTPAIDAAEQALADLAVGDLHVVIADHALVGGGLEELDAVGAVVVERTRQVALDAQRRVEDDALAEALHGDPVHVDALPRLAGGGRAVDVQPDGLVGGLAAGRHPGTGEVQVPDLDVLAVEQADAVGIAAADGGRARARKTRW